MSTFKPLAFLFDIDGVVVRWFSRLPDFLKSKGLPYEHVVKGMNKNIYMNLVDIFSTTCEKEAFSLAREYNSSQYIAELDAFDEQVAPALRELSKRGELIAVTCIGDDEKCHDFRKENLSVICGGDLFDEIHCLDIQQNKAPVIKEIAERKNVAFFVDDRPRHVREAMSVGVAGYQFLKDVEEHDIDHELNHVPCWGGILSLAEGMSCPSLT
ncbi:hypothetical protein ACQKQC_06370 [Vibrio fortis]|uniref:hypothetical protein n=1 Tax=Vibrio fortis TaxID=212667 RepID=UPI00406764E8